MINLVLVGIGGFGSRHLREVRRLESMGLARLTALVDPAFAPGTQANEVFPDLSGRLPRYPSLNEFLADEIDFDALTLATPIHLHEQMLHRLCPTEKFIYVEKPPVPTIDQLNHLLVNHSTARVAVAFQLIASPCVRQLKELILEGKLGDVLSIRASGGWPRDCSYYARNRWAGKLHTPDGECVFDGPATNAFAHLVHLITFLAGDSMDTFAVPERAEGIFLQARPMEAPDTVLLGGEFSGGARYRVAVTHCSRRNHAMELRIFGSKGSATLSDDASELTLNGALVRRGGGHDEAISLAYENFIGFAGGRLSRPATLLPDCSGYLDATWGAYQGSSGIEAINPELVSTEPSEGGVRYIVEGVDEVLQVCLEKDPCDGLAQIQRLIGNKFSQRNTPHSGMVLLP